MRRETTNMNMKRSPLLLSILLLSVGSTAFAQGPGTEVWRYYVATNASFGFSPALGPDGTIYFYANLNTTSGLWAVDTNGHLRAFLAGARAADCPTVASDGTVYVEEGATLVARDPALTNSANPVFTASANIISDIVLGADGTFYFGTYSPSDGSRFLAVSSTGVLEWQYPVTDGLAPGAIALSTDGTIYFVSAKTYALTPAGTVKWVFPFVVSEVGYIVLLR
jgi:outer membrane protein assembly factor BamB